MNFEFLGKAACFVAGWVLLAMAVLGALRLTWRAYMEAKGWPRIFRAMKLLKAQEAAEAAIKPVAPAALPEAPREKGLT